MGSQKWGYQQDSYSHRLKKLVQLHDETPRRKERPAPSHSGGNLPPNSPLTGNKCLNTLGLGVQ